MTSTIYSVWNQSTRRFDYYRGPGSSATHAGKPSHVGQGSMGATPEEAAWPLPPGAKKIGAGDHAVGRIASMGGFGFVQLPGYAIIGLVALTFWYMGRTGR